MLKKAGLLLLILLFFVLSADLHAQNPLLDIFQGKKIEEPEELPLDQRVKLQHQNTLTHLKAAQEAFKNLSPTAEEKIKEQLKQSLDLLAELQLYEQQILEALDRQKEYKKGLAQTQQFLSTWQQTTPSQFKDPNFELLDNTRTEIQLKLSRLEISDHALNNLQSSLEESKTSLIETEKNRRRIKEEYEKQKEGLDKDQLKTELEIAKLETKLNQAKVDLFKIQIKNQELLKQKLEADTDILKQQAAWLENNVKFTQDELDQKLKILQTLRRKLNQAIQKTRKEIKNISMSLSRLEPNLADSSKKNLLELKRESLQSLLNLLSQRFRAVDDIEAVWKYRFQILNTKVKNSQISIWEEQTLEQVKRLVRQEALFKSRLGELRRELFKQEKKWSQALTPIFDQYEIELENLYADIQLFETFIEELASKINRFSLTDRLKKIWRRVLAIWNFEVTSIDDKPITVKKLFFALVLLLLGYRVARRLSHWLGVAVFPRLGLEKGTVAGLQTLAFYLLITFVSLTILYIVNVPLTMFTVLGGALAIGVGFGSQNIVRNFISGLILLMEQPIKVGDMVEVEGTYGTIEKIGARSTRIRSFNNVHVIVPNSDFLEKNVINWTLSDDLVRVSVSVGIAYGSPTREAAKLIRKAVDEHGKVLKSPEPIVLFHEFGDNSLNFEVHFWISMRTVMDRRRVESDIRFKIDSLFREAGITIAFPQRDVHLDTIKPIEFRMVSNEVTEAPKKIAPKTKEPEDLKTKLKEKHGEKLKEKGTDS